MKRKMLKQRALCAALCAGMLTLCLAGCGDSAVTDASGAAEETTAAEGQTAEIGTESTTEESRTAEAETESAAEQEATDTPQTISGAELQLLTENDDLNVHVMVTYEKSSLSDAEENPETDPWELYFASSDARYYSYSTENATPYSQYYDFESGKYYNSLIDEYDITYDNIWDFFISKVHGYDKLSSMNWELVSDDGSEQVYESIDPLPLQDDWTSKSGVTNTITIVNRPAKSGCKAVVLTVQCGYRWTAASKIGELL